MCRLSLLSVLTYTCVCVSVYIESERHQMASLVIKHLAPFLSNKQDLSDSLTHFLSIVCVVNN
jgi:hypothetical protein